MLPTFELRGRTSPCGDFSCESTLIKRIGNISTISDGTKENGIGHLKSAAKFPAPGGGVLKATIIRRVSLTFLRYVALRSRLILVLLFPLVAIPHVERLLYPRVRAELLAALIWQLFSLPSWDHRAQENARDEFPSLQLGRICYMPSIPLCLD